MNTRHLLGMAGLLLALALPAYAETITTTPSGVSSSSTITAGTTAIGGTCTSGFVLFNNAGVVGCENAAGGGNVSNSGTPLANQAAYWTDATHIAGNVSIITPPPTSTNPAVVGGHLYLWSNTAITDDGTGHGTQGHGIVFMANGNSGCTGSGSCINWDMEFYNSHGFMVAGIQNGAEDNQAWIVGGGRLASTSMTNMGQLLVIDAMTSGSVGPTVLINNGAQTFFGLGQNSTGATDNTLRLGPTDNTGTPWDQSGAFPVSFSLDGGVVFETSSGGVRTCGEQIRNIAGVLGVRNCANNADAPLTASAATLSGALTLNNISASTQCLQAIANVVSGTGVACGGGGGSGTVNNCATTGGVAFYAATGTAVSCNAAFTVGNGGIGMVSSQAGFIATSAATGSLALNSTGTNFGFMTNNNKPDSWYLGFGPATSAGTAVITWTDNGAVMITPPAGVVMIGSNTALAGSTGEVGLPKIAASGSAPGAAGGKFGLVCGTAAGSAKLIAYAGTSTTPVTIADNIGAGVTGC